MLEYICLRMWYLHFLLIVVSCSVSIWVQSSRSYVVYCDFNEDVSLVQDERTLEVKVVTNQKAPSKQLVKVNHTKKTLTSFLLLTFPARYLAFHEARLSSDNALIVSRVFKAIVCYVSCFLTWKEADDVAKGHQKIQHQIDAGVYDLKLTEMMNQAVKKAVNSVFNRIVADNLKENCQQANKLVRSYSSISSGSSGVDRPPNLVAAPQLFE